MRSPSQSYGVLTAVWDHIPPDTGEHAPPFPSQIGWYSIYLPHRAGRLSWPKVDLAVFLMALTVLVS